MLQRKVGIVPWDLEQGGAPEPGVPLKTWQFLPFAACLKSAELGSSEQCLAKQAQKKGFSWQN